MAATSGALLLASPGSTVSVPMKVPRIRHVEARGPVPGIGTPPSRAAVTAPKMVALKRGANAVLEMRRAQRSEDEHREGEHQRQIDDGDSDPAPDVADEETRRR